jgi:voltage-gated potassium channel
MSDLIPPDEEKELEKQRLEILRQVENMLELPVMILGFVWLILLVIDLIWVLTGFLEMFFFIIWGIFIMDFLLRFILAPQKAHYLRRNWLTAISLMVPALRVFQFLRFIRVVRAARAVRSLNLVRVVSSFNRGMRALRNTMNRRGFTYILLLTLIVMFLGAAGIYTFELGVEGFEDYGDALWWTAMVMTTLGSGQWPQTMEGRILGFLIALYAMAVFGYVTATLATFFIGRDAESEDTELASAKKIESLRDEIRSLREELRRMNHQNEDPK